MTRRNDRGGAGLWIFLVVVAIGVWVGFRIGKLYFDHSTIENEVAVIGDRALTGRGFKPEPEVHKLMRIYSVDLDEDAVYIEKDKGAGSVWIEFDYTRTADFIVVQPEFHFSIGLERKSAKAAGLVQQVEDSITSSNRKSAGRWRKAITEGAKKHAK